MTSQITSFDEACMRQCIALGRAALSIGEAPVGALIVRGGSVLASASEATKAQMDVTAHAEVVALRSAFRILESIDLSECTLYTNVEPCVLCSYAIRRAGIQRVVIGVPTDALGGVTSTHPILIEDGIQGFAPVPRIVQNVLLDECIALLGEGAE